jgi:hypothetical protein
MKRRTRDSIRNRAVPPISHVRRSLGRIVAAGLLGLLAFASPGQAQDLRLVMRKEQRWGTAVVATSASSEQGVVIAVTSEGRSLRVTPSPTELEVWADSVLTILGNTLAVPPSGKIEVRVGPLGGGDGGRMTLVRTTTAAGVDNDIEFVGQSGRETLAFTLADSLVRPFALAARSAAVAEIAMAGDQCASMVASAIAKRGPPTTRERGSVNATNLFEKLTWKDDSGLTMLRYVWGSENRGCHTEGP